MDLHIELGPIAASRLGNESLQMSYSANPIFGLPILDDKVTFFVFGKDYIFQVVYRRWDYDEGGNAQLALGIELVE